MFETIFTFSIPLKIDFDNLSYDFDSLLLDDSLFLCINIALGYIIHPDFISH